MKVAIIGPMQKSARILHNLDVLLHKTQHEYWEQILTTDQPESTDSALISKSRLFGVPILAYHVAAEARSIQGKLCPHKFEWLIIREHKSNIMMNRLMTLKARQAVIDDADAVYILHRDKGVADNYIDPPMKLAANYVGRTSKRFVIVQNDIWL